MHQRPRTLRLHLLALVSATMLPVLVLGFGLGAVLVQEAQDNVARAASGRTRAIMTAVDAELRGAITTLEAFAASRVFEERDLEAFHAQAVRVLATQPTWHNVSLADPTGQQVGDARLPLGAALPMQADLATTRRVIETLRPAVGRLSMDPGNHQPGVPVRVPVVVDGSPAFVLTAFMNPATFDAVLRAQRLPEHWLIGALDQSKQFVTRVPAVPFGARAADALSAALDAGPEGWFRGRTLEGVEMYQAYARSSFSGWAVAIAIPATEVQAPAWQIAGGIAAAAAAALCAAAALAALLGRRIAAPMAALTAAARELGRGVPMQPMGDVRIAEIAEVGNALANAGDTIRNREETLARERSQLRAIIESMADGVVVVDMAGRVVLVNEANARLFGFASAAELMRDFAVLSARVEMSEVAGNPVPPEDWPASRVLRGESFRDVELCVRRTDTGEEWAVAFSGKPVRDGAGAQILALVVSRDVSQIRRVQRALEDLNRSLEHKVRERTSELEALNRDLEAFSYSVSHDLRAPVISVAGLAGLLEQAGSEAERNRLVQRILANTDRMSQLIDDLLKLSRVASGELVRSRVDLSALVLEVAASFKAARPDVGLSVERGVLAHADASLVRVLLENLIGNAWKFTAHTPSPRVSFGNGVSGGRPVYWIRDNGAGFDKALATRLFKPFQRLHRASEFEGTGIGLAIVQRIVRRHGGRAWAEGAAGKGAVFYFDLGEGDGRERMG